MGRRMMVGRKLRQSPQKVMLQTRAGAQDVRCEVRIEIKWKGAEWLCGSDQ